MRKRSVGINVRVTVTEKKKVTMLAQKCGLSLSEYLRQRALGYEPGGHPPTEVFDMRRKDAPPELADQRMALTCEIAKLRKEDKIAEGAIKRIQRTRDSNRIDKENRNQHTNNKTRRRDSSRQR